MNSITCAVSNADNSALLWSISHTVLLMSENALGM
jgi:hypothetical protein